MTAGDPTRNKGLRLGPGARVLFPGLTSDEAERLAGEIGHVVGGGAGGRGDAGGAADRLLVRIDVPAILSDGAGPHLLDAFGHLTIAIADHPRIGGTRVAMGEPHPGHTIGLVAPLRPGEETPFVWRWVGRRDVSPGDRVAGLDELDSLESVEATAAWERRAGPAPRGNLRKPS
jgi:hypothetical protein